MKSLRRLQKGLFVVSMAGIAGYAAFALAAPSASAAVRPLCGYSLLWDCTLPNGTHKLVGGTVCDINRYQQQTGAHCVPSGL